MNVLSELAAGQFVRLPPGRGYAWVSCSSRKEALAGLSLVTLSRPLSVRLQWGLRLAVKAAGARVLPGQRQQWVPPLTLEESTDFTDLIVNQLPDFDGLNIYERPQTVERPGFALALLRQGEPQNFIKVRLERAGLDRERHALQALGNGETLPFRIPTVSGWGQLGRWFWLALSPLPASLSRPARPRHLESMIARYQELLLSVLNRGDRPGHWLPMHGDLTPWNLRQIRRTTWLIDWEDIDFAPPSADRVYYELTRHGVTGQKPRSSAAEVVDFWTDRLRTRARPESEADKYRMMESTLQGMRDTSL